MGLTFAKIVAAAQYFGELDPFLRTLNPTADKCNAMEAPIEV
jgi:hypothetical protein